MDETNPLVDAHPESAAVQKTPAKTLWYALGALGVVAVAGGVFLWRASAPVPQTPTAVSQQSGTRATPTLPRSKTPGVVLGLLTAASLDTKGNPVAPSTVFAATDKSIYLSASLASPKVGTKIEYIRYLNGKYLDNGTLKVTKPSVTHVSFLWNLKKAGAKRSVGSYRVKVYTNGIFEKETSYFVK